MSPVTTSPDSRFEIRISSPDVKDLESALAKAGHNLPRYLAAEVNRAAKGAATDAVRVLRDDAGLNVRARLVRKMVQVKRPATEAHPEALVSMTGPSIVALMYYTPRPSRVGGRRPPVGASFLVWLNKGREVHPGTFLAAPRDLFGGKTSVYKRVGKERFPIEPQWGPGMAEVLADNIEAWQARVERRLAGAGDAALKRLMRESRYLDGGAA
jgi:hypothetical protein